MNETLPYDLESVQEQKASVRIKQTVTSGMFQRSTERTISYTQKHSYRKFINETCFKHDLSDMFNAHQELRDRLKKLIIAEQSSLTKQSCPTMEFELYNIYNKSERLTAKEHGEIVKAQLYIRMYRQADEEFQVACQKRCLLEKMNAEDIMREMLSSTNVEVAPINLPISDLMDEPHIFTYIALQSICKDVEVSGMKHGSKTAYIRFLDVDKVTKECMIAASTLSYLPPEIDTVALNIPQAPIFRLGKSDFGVRLSSTGIPEYVCISKSNKIVENIRLNMVCVELPPGWIHKVAHPYLINLLCTGDPFVEQITSDSNGTHGFTLLDFSVDILQRNELVQYNRSELDRLVETCQQKRITQWNILQRQIPLGHNAILQLSNRSEISRNNAVFRSMEKMGIYNKYTNGLLNLRSGTMRNGEQLQTLLNNVRDFERDKEIIHRENVLRVQNKLGPGLYFPKTIKISLPRSSDVSKRDWESHTFHVDMFPTADLSLNIGWKEPPLFPFYTRVASGLQRRLSKMSHHFRPEDCIVITVDDQRRVDQAKMAMDILESKRLFELDKILDGVHYSRMCIWEKDLDFEQSKHSDFLYAHSEPNSLDIMKRWSFLHWLLAAKWASSDYTMSMISANIVHVDCAVVCKRFIIKLPTHWAFDVFPSFFPFCQPYVGDHFDLTNHIIYNSLEKCDHVQADIQKEYSIFVDAYIKYNLEFPFDCVRDVNI